MWGKNIDFFINDTFLNGLFPPEKADLFFEALYGGAEIGAFDISLHYLGLDNKSNVLKFEFRLTERPGQCIACNLTQGLPQVFQRHPVIDIAGITDRIEKGLLPEWKVKEWSLGRTQVTNSRENSIAFDIYLEKKV